MPRRITITVPDKRLIPKSCRGIGIAAYICLLIRKNEDLALGGADEPWTDEQIRELVRKRFPKSKTVSGFYSPDSKTHTVNHYRSLFNRGCLGTSIDYRNYPFISFRYDQWGNKVNYKTGRRELTPQEIDDTVAKFWKLRRDRGVYVPKEIIAKLDSM